MVWRTHPFLPPCLWDILVHYCSLFTSECNQSVSSSRLSKNTHSSLVSDQNVARVGCLLLRASVLSAVVIIVSRRENMSDLTTSDSECGGHVFLPLSSIQASYTVGKSQEEVDSWVYQYR